MSLFLNDVEPVSIPVSGGEGKDEVEDDDLAVVTFDPHPRGSRSSRKRTNFPTRHGVPHKRRRHNSPTSTLLDLGDDDDDLVVLDGPPSRVEEPVMIQSVHPTTNQPSKQPDIADLIFLESESKVSVKPTVSRPVTQVKGPHYHISDPDLSGSFGITAANQEEALEISLEVGPELLNTVKNQERRIEDRESPKRFVFKLYASQRLRLIVEKFLEIDQSTWSLDELQLKLHGLEISFDRTPKDEGMVGGEALYLNLKSQPKGDDLPPVDFTPLQRDQIPIEEDTEEKIKVILQSKKWGEQTYRMAMDKPFGTLYDAFSKRNKLSPHETQFLSLRFDGMEVARNQTPEALDMEDEDTVDVVLKKK